MRLWDDPCVQRALVGGAEIAYRVSGDGPPMVLIHAAGLADFFKPLVDSDLRSRFPVISYQRVGYGLSSRAAAGVGIADQAEHCRGLLDHLGHDSAHVVDTRPVES
jgi:3-oxoadipate enol-lactonase